MGREVSEWKSGRYGGWILGIWVLPIRCGWLVGCDFSNECVKVSEGLG